MNELEFVSEKLQKQLQPRKTQFGELSADLTVKTDFHKTLFLTHVFKDGSLLAFWSHSPWGTCNDQEQGTILLSSDLEEIDSIATRMHGESQGGFKQWRANVKEMKGGAKKIADEITGELIWKKSEC